MSAYFGVSIATQPVKLQSHPHEPLVIFVTLAEPLVKNVKFGLWDVHQAGEPCPIFQTINP